MFWLGVGQDILHHARETQWLKRTLAHHTVPAVKEQRETDASAQLRLFIQDRTSAC